MDRFVKDIEREKDAINRDRMIGWDNIAETMKNILDLVHEIITEIGEDKRQEVHQHARRIVENQESFTEDIENLKSEYNGIGERIIEIDREISQTNSRLGISLARNARPDEPGISGAFDRFFTNIGGALEDFGTGIARVFSDAGQRMNLEINVGVSIARLDNLKAMERLKWRNIANINRQLELRFHMHRRAIGMDYYDTDIWFRTVEEAAQHMIDSL
jgi:hypothetical protein